MPGAGETASLAGFRLVIDTASKGCVAFLTRCSLASTCVHMHPHVHTGAHMCTGKEKTPVK